MAKSTIYIHNVTLDEVLDLRRRADDAHDPLNYCSFDWARSPSGAYLYDRNGNPFVSATKDGAHASHYVQDLQDRLWELGLIEAKVSIYQQP